METRFIIPESKQQPHFKTLIELLVKQFTPLYIYEFAQLVQVERVNSVFCSALRQEHYLYCLLVITPGSGAVASQIQAYADRHFTGAKVIVHAHAQDALLKLANPNRGYFAAVFSRGLLCYHAAGAPPVVAVKALNPKKWLGRAIVHWRNHHQMANGFLTAARQAVANGHYSLCLFLLHLAVAEACLGLIYVFMAYQSETTNLKHLLYTCACFSKRPLQYFLGTAENELLLKVLMRSDNSAIWEADFGLADKSADCFLTLVAGFLPLANKMCKAHFAALQLDVNAAKARRKEGRKHG